MTMLLFIITEERQPIIVWQSTSIYAFSEFKFTLRSGWFCYP